MSTTTERIVFGVSCKIQRNMDGWQCLLPMPLKLGTFEPILKSFLLGGEALIPGKDMIDRAMRLGVATGLRDAEAMLRGQEIIPKACRRFVPLFPEVWLNPAGIECVFCLYWRVSMWELNYDELRNGFNSDYRLISARSRLVPA